MKNNPNNEANPTAPKMSAFQTKFKSVFSNSQNLAMRIAGNVLVNKLNEQRTEETFVLGSYVGIFLEKDPAEGVESLINILKSAPSHEMHLVAGEIESQINARILRIDSSAAGSLTKQRIILMNQRQICCHHNLNRAPKKPLKKTRKSNF